MDTDQAQSRNSPLCPLGEADEAALPLCLKGSENPTLSNSWSDGLVDWNAANGTRGRRFETQSSGKSVWCLWYDCNVCDWVEVCVWLRISETESVGWAKEWVWVTVSENVGGGANKWEMLQEKKIFLRCARKNFMGIDRSYRQRRYIPSAHECNGERWANFLFYLLPDPTSLDKGLR